MSLTPWCDFKNYFFCVHWTWIKTLQKMLCCTGKTEPSYTITKTNFGRILYKFSVNYLVWTVSYLDFIRSCQKGRLQSTSYKPHSSQINISMLLHNKTHTWLKENLHSFYSVLWTVILWFFCCYIVPWNSLHLLELFHILSRSKFKYFIEILYDSPTQSSSYMWSERK